MAITNAAGLVGALRQHRLLQPAQLRELDRFAKGAAEALPLAKQLVQRGWLTSFQVNQVLQGRGADLVLGPYLLLDKLGEGGNGQVFKALQQTLKRVVALKILRKELLADPEAVGRFCREVEVNSQLTHQNIVRAFDARPFNALLVLAMEFVEGIDLDRLVHAAGPLAVPQAVSYIRQTAQGLHYAHECGLVHRDIKPSNLLVNRGVRTGSWGLLKIADLGLARLERPAPGSRTANLTVLAGNAMTQGTPDYMSPEQAVDFHSADARSDIYSLGCTFYYLLTGRPPFPGGSPTETLMRHQQLEPVAVEELRKDLPGGLPPVLRRLLAKKPKDRYQSAGEVALALAPFEEERLDTRVGSQKDTVLRDARQCTARVSPGGILGRLALSKRRRRLVLWACGGLALLTLVVAASSLIFKSSQPVATKRTAPIASPTSASVSASAANRANLVTIVSVSSGRPYDLAQAKVGVTYWIDRAYTIAGLSPALEGGVLLRGANDDKNVPHAVHLTFDLSAPANVYVAYDKRGTRNPAWLDDGSWHLTGAQVSASGGDAQASPMKVYVKKFPAGRVALGGNRQAPAAGAGSNYVVIVLPAP